jgi:hypothetical protein
MLIKTYKKNRPWYALSLSGQKNVIFILDNSKFTSK